MFKAKDVERTTMVCAYLIRYILIFYWHMIKSYYQYLFQTKKGVVSLSGHFATLCREFDFYEVKKNIIFFSKRKGKYLCTFTLLIIFIVKSLQKEQNSTNLQL